MNIFWIGLGIFGVFQISMGVCAHYGNDPKVVTIVGNSAIPVLAAFLVALMNEMKSQLALLTDEEE